MAITATCEKKGEALNAIICKPIFTSVWFLKIIWRFLHRKGGLPQENLLKTPFSIIWLLFQKIIGWAPTQTSFQQPVPVLQGACPLAGDRFPFSPFKWPFSLAGGATSATHPTAQQCRTPWKNATFLKRSRIPCPRAQTRPPTPPPPGNCRNCSKFREKRVFPGVSGSDQLTFSTPGATKIRNPPNW